MIQKMKNVCLIWMLVLYGSCAFTTPNLSVKNGITKTRTTSQLMESTASILESNSHPSNDDDVESKSLEMPLNVDQMIQQVANTIIQARSQNNCRRQIVRILLPRDQNNANLGQYYESEDEDSTEFVLVPPDESWQGGIMQLYRSAVPTCEEILKNLSNTFSITGIPPKIIEDRSIDDSGVDGVGILATKTNILSKKTNEEEEEEEITCYVQPLQESVPTILRKVSTGDSSDEEEKGLAILVNPQWRLVDDALDSASQMDGFLGSLASFLGGKGGVLKQLVDADFQSTYILEGYVCKGRNVRLLKTFNTKWTIWAETDNSTNRNPEFKLIGTSSTSDRPSYQDIESMFDDFTSISL